MSKQIGKYTLHFMPKIKRAYDKELGAGPKATDEEVLAYYDKFGGRITDEKGEKVETFTFWNAFKAKKGKKEEVKEEKPLSERDALKKELTDLKVEFKNNAPTKKLKALLEEAKK